MCTSHAPNQVLNNFESINKVYFGEVDFLVVCSLRLQTLCVCVCVCVRERERERDIHLIHS